MNNSGGETLYSLSEVYQIMIVSCIFHYIESTEEFPHANSHQQRYWDRVSTVTLLHNSFVFIFNEFLLQCCAINRNFKATHRSIFDGFFPSRQLSYSVDDGSHISGTVELDLGQAVLVGFHDPWISDQRERGHGYHFCSGGLFVFLSLSRKASESSAEVLAAKATDFGIKRLTWNSPSSAETWKDYSKPKIFHSLHTFS